MKIFGLHILTEQSYFKAISEAKAKATEQQRNMNTQILSNLLHENQRMRTLLGAVAERKNLRA